MTGPFKGAVYTEAHLAKVIGVYEKEIQPFFEVIKGKKFDVIYDIGAAGGYYVSGFSRIFPETTIIAYEMIESYWTRIREIAAQNKASEWVEVRGEFCGKEWSKHSIDVKSYLIMMDVEGAEQFLLNPEEYPILSRGHILVEIHENRENNCETTIRGRFSKTHQISEVQSEERQLEDFPNGIPILLRRLFHRTFLEILSDQRIDKQKWLLMVPKQ